MGKTHIFLLETMSKHYRIIIKKKTNKAPRPGSTGKGVKNVFESFRLENVTKLKMSGVVLTINVVYTHKIFFLHVTYVYGRISGPLHAGAVG